MKISKALRNAWKTYTASFESTMVFLAVEGCLVLICLAPLLFLTKKGMQWGAALSPLLWIFLRLPTRMNAAMVMRGALRGGSLADPGLADLSGYREKLVCGLKRAGLLLLWGAPLIALCIAGWRFFSGEIDSFTVLRMIRNDLGGGNQMAGLRRLGEIAAAAVVILIVGCAFHSGARHAFAQGKSRLLRGHHGGVMLAWLIGLLSLLPLLIALGVAVGRYMPVLSDLNGLLMRTVHLPSTRDTLLILGIGAVLTLPLLPLRGLIQAAFVRELNGGGDAP